MPAQRIPTILFDRSAFHGSRFEALRHSPLNTLIQRGTILVSHTPVFLEETLLLLQGNMAEVRKQLPFILSICNGRWFLERDRLWREELVKNKGRAANVYYNTKQRKQEERLLLDFIKGDSIDGYEKVIAAIDEGRRIQAFQHSTFKSLREGMAKFNRTNPGQKHARPTFKEYCAALFEETGRKAIKDMVITKNENLADMWSRNPVDYPYFTSMVEGMLYAAFYALTEHSKGIDKNAQMDIEHLVHLNDADIVVSCDERFMKDAFRELWEPRGKRYFSTEQFVSHLCASAGAQSYLVSIAP